MCRCVFLRDVKKGEFFTLKPVELPASSIVWVRGDYDRKYGYNCFKFDDVNHDAFWNGSKKVFVNFYF